MKDCSALLEKHGYALLRSSISTDTLNCFSQVYCDILEMQINKLGHETSSKQHRDMAEKVDFLCTELNTLCRPALLEAATMARNSFIGHKLAQEAGSRICDYFSNVSHLQISGPSIFVNIPNDAKGKYTAHTESHWYPKRQRFLNLWIPIIRSRSANDSMQFWPGTQRVDFPFTEYVGYGGDYNKDSNKQYEIPQRLLREWETLRAPDCGLGDMIVFDRRLVHASVDNPYSHPLYAITIRVFDYSSDLTLSSHWAEVPYSNPTPLWKRIS